MLIMGRNAVLEPNTLSTLTRIINTPYFRSQILNHVTANVVSAFMNKHRETGIALLVFLLLSTVLMWVIYIWSWNYTVKALTIGFE